MLKPNMSSEIHVKEKSLNVFFFFFDHGTFFCRSRLNLSSHGKIRAYGIYTTMPMMCSTLNITFQTKGHVIL